MGMAMPLNVAKSLREAKRCFRTILVWTDSHCSTKTDKEKLNPIGNKMILENVEIWYCKCDPARPEKSTDKDKPDYWSVQVRTSDKEIKNEWEELNINVKAMVPDEGEVDYKATFRRKVINSRGEATKCPEVVNGNLDPIDPKSIGNGSVGNLILFQHDYPAGNGYAAGIASVLMKVQLTKHVVYIREDEEFAKTTTDVVSPEAKAMDETDGDY